MPDLPWTYWAEDMDEALDEGHEGLHYSELLGQTEKAIHLRFGSIRAWIPRSQIDGWQPEKRWILIAMWLREAKQITSRHLIADPLYGRDMQRIGTELVRGSNSDSRE